MVPVVIPAMVIVMMVVMVMMVTGGDHDFHGFSRGSSKTGEANDGQEQDEQCFHIWDTGYGCLIFQDFM